MKIMIPLVAVFVFAAVDAPAFAAQSDVSSLLATMGVERDGDDYVWSGSFGRRLLNSSDGRLLEDFAAALSKEANREETLVQLERRELEAAGRAAGAPGEDGTVWLSQTESGWILTDAGRRAVPGIVLKTLADAAETSHGGAAPLPESLSSARQTSFDGAFRDFADGPVPTGDRMRGVFVGAENARVLAPGRLQASLRGEADNYLMRETNGSNWLKYKAETHSLTAEFRRGLDGPVPIEVGGSVSAYEQDGGFLNGFISGFEHTMASVFGANAVNKIRSGPNAMRGTVQDVNVEGSHADGSGRYGLSLGDASLIVKAALEDASTWSISPSAVATIATGGPFSTPSSLAAGLSAQRALAGRWSLFADAAAAAPLQSRDSNGIALKNGPVLDATVGVNYRASKRGTLTVQLDYAGSPYAKTGLAAYDNSYTDLAFGWSYRFAHGLKVAVYGSEDFNLGKKQPGAGPLAPYGPADFSAGVKVEREF